MKLPALLLAGSLVANAAFLGVMAFRPALAPPVARDFFQSLGMARPAANNAARVTARAATPASAIKPWTALRTDDLRTLINNLRAAGFPPAIVRAIVSAQIEERTRDRFRELIGSVRDIPFWKPDPMNSGLGSSKIIDSYNQIYRDRGKMMRELLGNEYYANSAAEVTAVQRRQFGNIAKEKIDLVQRINEDYQEMQQQVRAATQGITLPEDREKMALLEREKRADLAAILTPAELEEYLMHTSTITSRLRQPLTIMDATESEFRTIYGIQQKYADIIYPNANLVGMGVTTPESRQQRLDAEKAMNEQIQAALGPERGAEFVRASSNEFQQLYRFAQRDGLGTDAAVRAFTARDQAAQESQRIFNDQAMSNADKRAALATLAQTTRSQLIGALGVEAGTTYAKNANWLTQIERGAMVTFNGNSTSTRMVPPDRAAPKN